MFTGIVEELGEIVAVEQLPNAARLTVRGPLVTSDAKHGDSIAVNGVCLTVVETGDGQHGYGPHRRRSGDVRAWTSGEGDRFFVSGRA